MRKCVLLAVVALGRALPGGVAAAQRPMEIAFAKPQPHFVAAWAPKEERAAERAAVLARRASLDLAGVTVDAALKALTTQLGLRITYSPAILPKANRVTIRAGDVAVVTALTEILFGSGLDVVVGRDGALAIVNCQHHAAKLGAVALAEDAGSVSGRVTDKATGGPIAGATVLIETTGRSARTNDDGKYRIAGLAPGEYALQARYIGYVPLSATVTVSADSETTLNFTLARSIQVLNELVTVTPGGLQSEVKALPSPITIVTSEDIDRQRPRSIQDIVRLAVPTAVAFDLPSRPDRTALSVRGASSLTDPGVMKVLIDGVEASVFGSTPIDPASIERVEIVRGPQAATLYGSDAVAGVVQIFTKRGELNLSTPKVVLGAHAGVAQTPYQGFGAVFRQQYAASVRGGSNDMSYNFGGGYTALSDWLPDGELSGQSSPNVYGGMRFARGTISVDLHGRYYKNQVSGGLNPLLMRTGFIPYSQPTFQTQGFSNETYGTRVTLTPVTWWRNQFTLGLDRWDSDNLQTRRRLTTPDDTLFQIVTEDQRKISLSYNASATATLGPRTTATLAAGVDHYQIKTSDFYTSQALNTEGTIETSPPGAITQSRARIVNTGYFGQIELGYHDALFLTAGLRAEDNSTFGQSLGTPLLPRIGLSLVQPLGQVIAKVRGAYGKAIRAPSPGAAFGSVSPGQTILPNPLLAPERQRGWDAGIDLAIGRTATLSITAYDQIAENLIAFVQVGSIPVPTFQFQNIGRVSNRGLEIEGKVSLTRLPIDLQAQYGYVRSRIDDLGSIAATDAGLMVGDIPLGLPAHTAGAAVSLKLGRGTALAGRMNYVGGYRQVDVLALLSCFGGTGPCQSEIRDYNAMYPAFVKLNATITQRVAHQVEAILSVDNLTNSFAYEGSNASAVMGRTTMVGLRAEF